MKRFLILALVVGLPVLAIVSFFADAGGFYSLFQDGKRILGLVGLSFLSIQLLLSSRIPFLERGYGLDKLIRLHRGIGTAALVLLLAHGLFDPIGMLVNYGELFYMLPDDWARLLGLTALLGVLLTGLTAIFRRVLNMPYEKWKNLHRFNYVVVPMVLLHSLVLGTTIRYSLLAQILYGIAVASYLGTVGYRLKTWIDRKLSTYTITQVETISYDTISLTMEGPPLKRKAGQFVMIQSFRNNRPGPTHPFTISSPPDGKLRVAVKSVGDFTSREIPAMNPGDIVRVEGPFGIFTLDQIPDGADILFLAGGIGITPFIAMLGSLAESDSTRQIRLVWGNKQIRDISFLAELQSCLARLPGLKIRHVFSEVKTVDQLGTIPELLRHERIAISTGYIDQEVVRAQLAELDDPWIMLCGPVKMLNLTRSSLGKLGVQAGKIFFERFDL